jgi:hypothetical protein
MPPAGPAVPPGGALAFQGSRNGSPIGKHTLNFAQDGARVGAPNLASNGTTTVHIEADFRVGFSFITLYRYHHAGIESWRDGQFQSLETTTNDNGTAFQVSARRTTSGILIRATGLPEYVAPPDALPLTHWAIAAMTAPLFNPQTGRLLREVVRPRGQGTTCLANGKPIRATRFALGGEAPIEDWYDASSVWTALDARGKDGSNITYRRI